MRKSLLTMSVMACAITGHDLHAQTRTVTGRVVGADGSGLPGVTVLVKGTTNGTSTDGDGRYSLTVPGTGGTLVFSSVGYSSQEAALGNASSINMTLAAASTGLDEVVVLGYGITQSRRELTGSIATVKGSEIATAPVQSFDQALQGRASGVNITTPNGVLNNPPVVRIRGVNSISLSSDPLYVIDGVPAYSGNNSALTSVPNNPLSNINPNDIESIEVLKDASSTAIYGSRAANGVILITTKKGKRGQSRISVDSWVGISKPVRLYDVLSAQPYMDLKNEAVRNLNANRAAIGQPATNVEGFRPSLDANGNQVDTRWYDYIYRTGFTSSNAVSFAGGSDKTTYYASVGYSDQKGMLVNNTFKRISSRLNVDHKVYKSFSVGARVGYSNSKNQSPNSGSVSGGAFGTGGLGRLPLVLPPNVAAYNNDGSYNIAGVAPFNSNGIGPGANLNPASTTGAPLLVGYYNPVVELDNNYFRSESNQIEGSVYANWEIINGLHARTTYGLNNVNFEDRAFYTAISGDGWSATPGAGGTAANYYRTNKRWNWQNTLSFDRTLADKHTVSATVGTEQQHTEVIRWGASRTGVADNFFETFEGNFTNVSTDGLFQGENFLLSYFGRVSYDFSKKYVVAFNARRDGYSAWGNKWGNFYGGALGYVLSEEGFWKNASFLQPVNFLKLSASYGEVGNALGVGDYSSLQLYSSGLNGPAATLYYSLAGNPNLTWETSKKTDVALAFGLFDDRLSGDVTYYRNDIDGLILPVPQAPSKGIPNNSIDANVGSMRNTGIEVNLRVNAIQTKNFTWTSNINFSTLKNEVLALATEGQRIGTATSTLETVNYTRVGGSVGEILAVQSLGVNPANGQRLIQTYQRDANGNIVRDGSGNPVIVVKQYNHQGTTGVGSTGWTIQDTNTNTTAPTQLVDGIYYGPVLPKWYGGFDNTFRFRGVDLGVFIQYSGGNYIYNGTKAGLHDQRFWNNDVDMLDHWTGENRTAKWPRPVYGDNVSNGSALIMSENVEKGDFARLRNVTLGYTFSSELTSKLKMQSARVYLQGQNVALLTKYSGIDPEISTNGNATTGAGVDRNSVGQARSYTLGVNLTF
ncbi:TonB-dependent receptor [Hymenobacter sp. 15J16-1T3B]|uniref:SusC/RagA family TonB-linked outer membrane protein n=1 Tax=Hymenobacter sp. 15J16-1T3B TaxID=2886941 RepID=UPI001D10F7BF|nr:TonB-dependent receptor [Hymenobacter sp. 15J16-1T3B]MCC3156889.1 TonB-dependent receptor [Hymenobacter sp. 15J16-1T3B]